MKRCGGATEGGDGMAWPSNHLAIWLGSPANWIGLHAFRIVGKESFAKRFVALLFVFAISAFLALSSRFPKCLTIRPGIVCSSLSHVIPRHRTRRTLRSSNQRDSPPSGSSPDLINKCAWICQDSVCGASSVNRRCSESLSSSQDSPPF